MLNGLQIGAQGKPQTPPVAPAHIKDGPNGSVVVDPAQADSSKPNEPQQSPQQSDPNRPAWLPEKFKTPEEAMAAYAELEKKLGAPKETPPVAPAAAKAAEGLDMSAIEAEFAKSEGKLSEATLKQLTDRGLTSDFVASYVAGRQAEYARTKQSFVEIAGSEEQLKAILEWAPEGLEKAEAEAYQAAVDRGDATTAKMLFENMARKYVAANGQDPQLVTAANVPGVKGVKPFESWNQVQDAMADRRYQTGDAAYINSVVKRLSVSNL